MLMCNYLLMQNKPEAPVPAAAEKYGVDGGVDCRPAQTLRVDTPVFQPRSQSPTRNLSQAAHAAVFIPRSQGCHTPSSLRTGMSSPSLSNVTLPTPEPSTPTPALTPLASSLYRHLDSTDLAHPCPNRQYRKRLITTPTQI